MIKKLLIFSILLFSTSTIMAQELPLDLSKENAKKSQRSFKEITNAYKTHFADMDIDKKGSGYKPFKRWEYRWSHYLQEDGTIAPAEHLWKAWEQKQKMSKSSKAVSNWTSKGPFDQSSKSGQGRINTVVVDPNNANVIYSGAPAGGLWKSTDSGTNWTPLTDDLPQIGVSGIAIDPNDSNIIYISTDDDDAGDSYSIGVLKSINGGTTWNTTGVISATSISSNEIVIDPTDSDIVWVATDEGLYKSTNAGTSWDLKRAGNIRDFKLKPGDPGTIYAVSSNIFYLSTNGGTSFSTIGTSAGMPAFGTIGRLRVEVTPAAPNNVYVLAAKTGGRNWAFDGIYVSTDSGVSFAKTAESDDIFGGSTQAWYDLAFSVSNTDANIMFVGVLDIWKSTNGGDNFTQINDWRTVNSTFTHADIHFMRYYNGVLYAGTDGGTYVSSNDGTTFTDLTKTMSISQFYKVTVAKQNSNKVAGGLQDNGGFSYSNNVWHNYHGGDGMDSASDPNDENTFYGFTQFGGFLTVTTDGGLTSTGLAQGPSQGNWITPLVANKSSELYSGYGELYRLDNGGWTQISAHSFGGNLEALEIDPSNNDIIYTSRGTTLYKSVDRGATFATLFASSTGISGVNVSSIEVHNSNSNIVWLTTTGVNNIAGPSSGHTGGGVYKSIDGGATFTDISAGLPNESKFVVRHHPFTTNNSIYVGTALGVYHRNDDDNVWEVFSTNLPNVAVSDLEINPYDNTITAATYGRSVWQSAIPAVSQPNNEVDLIEIASPNNSVTCGNITPSLTVINNGQNALTSFTVNYNIDGGANQVFNWTGNIASNATATVDLPTISAASEGQHTLNTEIVKAGDANLFNNNASSLFTVNPTGTGKIVYTFGDPNPGVNENAGTWNVSENNLWEIGTPTSALLNGSVVSGYVTNPSGNYPDQTVSYLTSPCYNLTILQDPVLKFNMAFDLERNWDVVYVEYSTDEGANWQVLGTASDPNWYNSNRTAASSGNIDCFNCPGAQWTGTDSALKEYSYNLAPLNGESSIIFRFKFQSDQSVNNEGVVVDDFVIDATAVLSVNDFEEGEFLIYPNPSSDIFNIRRMNTIGENMTVKVFDVTGKLIRQRNNIVDANYELNMSDISKGIYFLQVNIENKRLVKKLILN